MGLSSSAGATTDSRGTLHKSPSFKIYKVKGLGQNETQGPNALHSALGTSASGRETEGVAFPPWPYLPSPTPTSSSGFNQSSSMLDGVLFKSFGWKKVQLVLKSLKVTGLGDLKGPFHSDELTLAFWFTLPLPLIITHIRSCGLKLASA